MNRFKTFCIINHRLINLVLSWAILYKVIQVLYFNEWDEFFKLIIK